MEHKSNKIIDIKFPVHPDPSRTYEFPDHQEKVLTILQLLYCAWAELELGYSEGIVDN